MEEKCINCICYHGVEGSAECTLMTYSWAVAEGNIPENNFLFHSLPIRFSTEENKEQVGFMAITTMAGNTCPRFQKAPTNSFCEKCGKRLVSFWPSFCHNCGHPVSCDEEDE